MITYEKASATELRIITPQPQVRSLKEIKARKAELDAKRISYPLQMQAVTDLETAKMDSELAELNRLISEAGKLAIVEEVVVAEAITP